MKLNKIMLATALPVLGICMTSCGGNQSRSYADVLKHVIEKYDDHAIDYVTGDYKLNINNIGIDLDAVETNAVGIERSYKLAFGLKDTSITYKGLQGFCFSSVMLNYLEAAYDSVVKLTLENVTEFNLDKFYYINGDELTAKIGTDDSVFGLLVTANNALNVAMKIPAAAEMIHEKLGNIPMAEMVLDVYEEYSILISANSTADGEFYVGFKTDKNGFIKNLSLDFNTKLDIYANVTSMDASEISYTFHLSGDINLSTSIDVTF